jgi:hypothetical protein
MCGARPGLLHFLWVCVQVAGLQKMKQAQKKKKKKKG